MRRMHIIITLVATFILVLLAWFLLRPGAAPWTPSGTLTLLVDAVPEPGAPDNVLDIGVRNVRLHTADGDTETLTLGATRVSLDPHHSAPQTLQALVVPIGTYVAVSFELRSPALRNNWHTDEAPGALTLAHEFVRIPLPVEIIEHEETVLHTRFETARAIRTDETGEFDLPVYLPALTLDVWQGATITPNETGLASVSGGTLKQSTFYGQQWNGTMHQHKRAKDRLLPEEPTWTMPDIAEQSTSTAHASTTTSAMHATTSTEQVATTTDGAV